MFSAARAFAGEYAVDDVGFVRHLIDFNKNPQNFIKILGIRLVDNIQINLLPEQFVVAALLAKFLQFLIHQ